MENRKPQLNDICPNCKIGKLQYMYEHFPYSDEHLWCENCNSAYSLNHKVLWQEDLNSLTCDIIDFIEEKINKHGIVLSDENSDKMFDKIVDAIGVLGIEEYRNHN
jgi:uncharacterized protein YbaR (Trm112 family)